MLRSIFAYNDCIIVLLCPVDKWWWCWWK